jgi:hypothetical protein
MDAQIFTPAWRRQAGVAATVLLCLCQAAIVAAQQQPGAGSSRADVPGHPAFRAGARLLLGDDWATTDIGDVPETMKVVGGTVEIVDERGGRFLKVTESASFDVVLPEHLPESYTIDFDMQVPSSTGYAVEVRPDVGGSRPGYAGVSRRAEHPVVHCGAIGSGVYGTSLSATKRFDDRFAAAMVPCQIVVSPKGVKVYFAGQLAANVPEASLGQTNRVRIHVPADGRSVALIGVIRVATDVGADLMASGAEAAPPAPVGQSPDRSPEPASRVQPNEPAPASEPVAEEPVRDASARESSSSASAAGSARRGVAAGSGMRGVGDRIRRRAEARATARLDSAASKAEQKVEAGTEKALGTAADITDKAIDATDRVVNCLVTDLGCIRRAKRAGAKVAVTDAKGQVVSSADSARAMARANQPPPASQPKP